MGNKTDHENKHDPKGDIKLAGEPEPHPEPPENIGHVQPLAPTSDGHRTCPYMSALAAPTAFLATREPGSSAPATAPAQGLAQGKIPLSFFSSDDGITAAQGVLKKLEEAPAEDAKKRKSFEAATPVDLALANVGLDAKPAPEGNAPPDANAANGAKANPDKQKKEKKKKKDKGAEGNAEDGEDEKDKKKKKKK